jgi:hypothetical protein
VTGLSASDLFDDPHDIVARHHGHFDRERVHPTPNGDIGEAHSRRHDADEKLARCRFRDLGTDNL